MAQLGERGRRWGSASQRGAGTGGEGENGEGEGQKPRTQLWSAALGGGCWGAGD